MPLQLVLDAGAANTSYLFANYLQRLGVKLLVHTPGNPRGKGQVEATHNLIERGYEGLLRFGSRVETIEELNAHAHVWMRWANGARAHSRHGRTRYALWQTIREAQLRIAPPRELSRELLRTKPVATKVSGALMVRHAIPGYGSHHYDVSHIEGLRVGDLVDVVVNPYRAPNVYVITHDGSGAECLHECIARPRNHAGFFADAPVFGERFAAQPDTPADADRKALLKLAYGEPMLEAAEKKAAKNAQAFVDIDPLAGLERATVAHYMERRGVTLPLERPRTEAPRLTAVQVAKRLRDRGIPMDRDRYALVQQWYPEGVPEDDLDALVARLAGRDIVPRSAAG